MKLNDYQSAARKTAIYPGNLTYPTLGLCGEVGELTEACLNESDQVPSEIGDVLWYLSNTAADADLALSKTCIHGFGYVGNPLWSDSKSCEWLAIHAGRVAENVKKTIRDNQGVLTEARRMSIANALASMMFGLSSIAKHNGTTLEQCAKANLVKLQSRAERGVLKGDGEDR